TSCLGAGSSREYVTAAEKFAVARHFGVLSSSSRSPLRVVAGDPSTRSRIQDRIFRTPLRALRGRGGAARMERAAGRRCGRRRRLARRAQAHGLVAGKAARLRGEEETGIGVGGFREEGLRRPLL